MTRSEVLRTIRATGCTARWESSTLEYRINVRGGTEHTAYYTDDPFDAIGTAEHMAKCVAEGKWDLRQSH